MIKRFILLLFCIFLPTFTSAQNSSSPVFNSRSSLFFKEMDLTIENIQKEKNRLTRIGQTQIIQAVYGRLRAHLIPRYASGPLTEVKTLLTKAIQENKKDVVTFLVNDGARISREDIIESMNGPKRFEIFKNLIRRYKLQSKDIKALTFNINYFTDPLHAKNLLDEFFELEANLTSIKNTKNWSLLNFAVYSLNPHVTHMLLAESKVKGLDPNIVDQDGNTLFHLLFKGLNYRLKVINEWDFEESENQIVKMAQLKGRVLEIIESLNSFLIDISIENNQGLTPLEKMDRYIRKVDILYYGILYSIRSSFFSNEEQTSLDKLIYDLLETPSQDLEEKDIKKYLVALAKNYNRFESPHDHTYMTAFNKVQKMVEQKTLQPFIKFLLGKYEETGDTTYIPPIALTIPLLSRSEMNQLIESSEKFKVILNKIEQTALFRISVANLRRMSASQNEGESCRSKFSNSNLTN